VDEDSEEEEGETRAEEVEAFEDEVSSGQDLES
jgi:hypothetical protein